MGRLPVLTLATEDRVFAAGVTPEITGHARARYALHQKTRRQIQRDLGTAEKPLNQKLTAWWSPDFSALRAEIRKVYKRDIPVKERGEWDEWLADQRAEHGRLTGEIVARETELERPPLRAFAPSGSLRMPLSCFSSPFALS